MKKLVLQLIVWYQRYLSPDTGSLGRAFFPQKVCRFFPSCSVYTYESVNHHGIIKGLFLGLRRIMRCHPWSRGGFDPVKQ